MNDNQQENIHQCHHSLQSTHKSTKDKVNEQSLNGEWIVQEDAKWRARVSESRYKTLVARMNRLVDSGSLIGYKRFTLYFHRQTITEKFHPQTKSLLPSTFKACVKKYYLKVKTENNEQNEESWELEWEDSFEINQNEHCLSE